MVLPQRLHELDVRLFRAAQTTHTPQLDRIMPPLTNFADHAKLWVAVAGGLALFGGRFGRRAATRGMLAVAANSAIVNGPVKWSARRARPDHALVPLHRLSRRIPRSSSFPSGHAATAFAFTAAVAQEQPRLAFPVGALAAGVAYSRVHVGVHYPGDVVAGALLGTAIGVATRRVWPVAPHEPARSRQATSVPPRPTGAGLVVVGNPSAGPALSRPPLDDLRSELPDAKVVEVEDAAQLRHALEQAGTDAEVLGVVGGDGSVNIAAQVAYDAGLPLVVVPAGTLNHFARDVGVESVAYAVQAVQRGEAAEIDLATIAGRGFVNTASFGSYPELVDARERLEQRIGKWPALLFALIRVLRSSTPLRVEIDGRPQRVWMVFIGNCRYRPSGFAPTWRERLDDGQLDVRTVDGGPPWGRTRLVAAILTGRLGRSRVYTQRVAEQVSVRSLDGPLRLARDGETFDGPEEFVVCKEERRLVVYTPATPA